MTKNELTINNWVRHREQGEKPYRITSITIDGDKYLYTAEGLTEGDIFVDVRAAAFEPIALNEFILKSCGYVQMVDPTNIVRSEKYFSSTVGKNSLIEVTKNGHFNLAMSGERTSFLTKKVKYLHELQNLCKAFDNSIINVDWTTQTEDISETDSNTIDEGEPMW